MKTWDKQDQNHKLQDNQFSQSQRVSFSQRWVARQVRNQAFSHRNLQRPHRQHHQAGKKNRRTSRRFQLPLMKTQQLLKNIDRRCQLKRTDHLTLMKLRKSLPLFHKSSQPPVRLVKCLVRHTFRNFKDNSKTRRMQGKTQRLN